MKIKNNILINVENSDIKNGTFEIPKGVTSIGNRAFYDCTSLQHLTIPDSVTSIGNCAFDGCRSLESITIPKSVKSIGNSAFYCCESLKDITIPDSVIRIDNAAFEHCTNLQSVTIGNGVTSIGKWAFGFCTSLKSEKRTYKTFKPDLSCRNYQYELGKWSNEIEDIMIRNKGYHYCTNLFDIFNNYYGTYGKDFVICECEVGDKVLTHNKDSICCTNKIKPIRKLEWGEVLNILNGGNDKRYEIKNYAKR